MFLRESSEAVDLASLTLASRGTDLEINQFVEFTSKFAWSPVIGSGQEELFDLFDIKFDTAEGNLVRRKKRNCDDIYGFKKTRKYRCYLACDVAGMQIPLGFNLKTISKGLIVSYT